MNFRKAYSFNDVLLVPKRSSLNSRSEADLSTTVAGISLKLPIIAANMSSVCEENMALTLGELGGIGIIHRFCTIKKQVEMLRSVNAGKPWYPPNNPKVGFSIGIGEDWLQRLDACQKWGHIACLDIAHAHHTRVFDVLRKYFEYFGNFPLIIGQVSTPNAVKDILNLKEVQDHLSTIAFKCSIGGGSLCTTRIATGYGVPTLQAVLDIHKELPEVCIIADGGIKTSGDIVKSLAAGANAVMLGSLLAGTDESPGQIIRVKDQLYKHYAGSAAFFSKNARNEPTRNIEGEETLVPYSGSVKRVVENLADGIRSGFSYGGATKLSELQKETEFVEISVHGYQESLAHGK